jgi:hypothetical protein
MGPPITVGGVEAEAEQNPAAAAAAAAVGAPQWARTALRSFYSLEKVAILLNNHIWIIGSR